MPYQLLSSLGQKHPIDRVLYVGRDPSCAIRPPDSLVSRMHACLWLDRGLVRVRDEHSSNGTFVNGTRLEPGHIRTLHTGDQVQFGDSLYTLHGSALAADQGTLLEPPKTAAEPLPLPLGAPTQAAPASPAAPYAPPSLHAPTPEPPAPAPARRLNGLLTLAGGCALGVLLTACAVAGFMATPVGRQVLAALINGE